MGKRITCRVGWHHWHVVAEDSMQVRVCADCGRRRYHQELPGKKSPAASWGMNYTAGAASAATEPEPVPAVRRAG